MNIKIILDLIISNIKIKFKSDLRQKIFLSHHFSFSDRKNITKYIAKPLDRFIEKLYSLGLIEKQYQIIKENNARCRVIIKAKNKSNKDLIIKWQNINAPLCFNYLNSLSTEIYLHEEIANKLNEFIPKSIFHDNESIAIEYIDGIKLKEILVSEDAENISKYINIILNSLIKTYQLTKEGEVNIEDFNTFLMRDFNYMTHIKDVISTKEIISLFNIKIDIASAYENNVNKIREIISKRETKWIKSLCYLDLDLENIIYKRIDNSVWIVDTEDSYFGSFIFDLAFLASRVYLIENSIDLFKYINEKFIGMILKLDTVDFLSSIKLFNYLLAQYLILSLVNPSIDPINNYKKIKNLEFILFEIESFDYEKFIR